MTVRMTPKYTEAEVLDADRFINDPQWVMEQKMDGTRGLSVITPDGVWWPGAGGVGSLKHSAAVQHFGTINPILSRLLTEPGELVLDGEIMIRTGEYRLFDVPYMRAGGVELVRPTDPFWRRREVLESVGKALAESYALNADPAQPVHVVRQARSQREKADMWAAINAAGVEGAMVKHLDSTYQPGVRVKDVLRLKLVKTADVVVYKSTRSRNEANREVGSFFFGVYEAGQFVQLGSCSAIGKPETAVGDVIEVAYLYREPGDGSLVQPRMVKVRTDKEPHECGFDQFPTYSREVV